MMVQEKNIRERDYNEALFTLDVFNNRELSPVVPCCPPCCPTSAYLLNENFAGIRPEC